MNKLDVAIRLIQMLNERKFINSNIIAEEFDVSLRTAQRYIKELSTLPCFVSHENSNCYELVPNYKFKEALLHSNIFDIIRNKLRYNNCDCTGDEVFCLVCGAVKGKICEKLFVFDDADIDNKLKFDQIITIIRDILREHNCRLTE
jgi:hypothetical protein